MKNKLKKLWVSDELKMLAILGLIILSSWGATP